MSSVLDDLRNRNIGPLLYHRKEKTTIRERIPLFNLLENTVLFRTPLKHFDETAVIRDMLMSESINDEHKYNSYESAKDIPKFVDHYEIDMTAFKREMPSQYVSFNDFFTRQVKPERRPVAGVDDDNVITSAADCRLTVFADIRQAKELLIKGKKFSLETLVGPDRIDLIKEFKEGSCANFRLAPSDYHRFHSPISGKLVDRYFIAGQTYPTEVMALQSEINIITENERVINVVEREDGLAMLFCAIGAEGVGRVESTIDVGQDVSKGDELGYFHYGGSDIFVAWNRTIKWDEDLRLYSLKTIETLVEANEKIGVLA